MGALIALVLVGAGALVARALGVGVGSGSSAHDTLGSGSPPPGSPLPGSPPPGSPPPGSPRGHPATPGDGQSTLNGEERPGTAPASSRTPAARDLGQLIVARFPGVQPPPALLRRIERGQVGGVILFADNTASGVPATRSSIATLQAAARRGARDPLLIMADQEGGATRRLMSLPPFQAPRAIASAAAARAQGLATGQALRRVGIDVDLAPVADVEHAAQSFLGDRSFGSSAQTVEQRACAFAAGLSQAGVAYTLKHFPGLGWASASTDNGPVVVGSSSTSLRADYGAYRRCGHGALALVMIDSAGYPGLTGSTLPAVILPEIYRDELHRAGVRAVTISDDLDTPAIAGQRRPALRAVEAGLDLLLYAQTGASSADAYAKLLADLEAGALSRARVGQAAAAVRALKRSLAATAR